MNVMKLVYLADKKKQGEKTQVQEATGAILSDNGVLAAVSLGNPISYSSRYDWQYSTPRIHDQSLNIADA